MAVKIENRASIKAPPNTSDIIQKAFDVIPLEHLRGLNKVILVDYISPHQRIQIPNISELPGLYHPKVGTEQPYFEIALGVLAPPKDSFFKKFASKLNFKANLTGLIFSLQAQHYQINLGHGVKKHQFENAVKNYMDKYFVVWRERNGGWRAKAFKPLQPYIEKWSKSLKQKYEAEQRKKK
jgi:hypothetical protein